jgi:hypothetical protein
MNLTGSIFDFVKELDAFCYSLSVLDHVWNVLFPDDRKKWHHLHINKYKDTFYITYVTNDGVNLEVKPKKSVRAMGHLGASYFPIENHARLAEVWQPAISSARKWLKLVWKGWIKANKRVQLEYPLSHRYGVASNALIRASLPGVYRLDKELGKGRANQHFSRDKDVFDVMHCDDLGRYKRRITPFITWEPLPILKPKQT